MHDKSKTNYCRKETKLVEILILIEENKTKNFIYDAPKQTFCYFAYV